MRHHASPLRVFLPRVLPLCVVLAMATACQSGPPPTITPGSVQTGGTTIDIPLDEPAGVPIDPANLPPLAIDSLEMFRDAQERFSLQVPPNWIVEDQSVGGTGSDVRLGYLFSSPEGTGLISITQFDNGRPPENVGNLASQVMEMSGVTAQPGFVELRRANVLERQGQAIRVELSYNRSDGVPMHSLVQFQADGTVFSMVNVSVHTASWPANERFVHDILGSYQVPAVFLAPDS
jgi:hypothetical protein